MAAVGPRVTWLIVLAMLLASSLVASAQEPPSLRAAPDPGAVAQESRDVLGRWLGATDAAVQSFARVGGSLNNIVTGKFSGLSNTIAVADAVPTLGAASAGDVRGAVSGAAAIAVGGKVTAGGAALFGEAGSIAGGAIGTFFPVIGNIAGSIVGGAVGAAAGGFICAFGYDKYVKDYVAKGATGIMSVFDTAPASEAMQAKRAFLWATMPPEQQAQLQTFKPEEVTLLDFGTLPYVVVPKQPLTDAQQAALGNGVPASFELNQNVQSNYPLACTVKDAHVTCFGRHSQGANATLTISLTGTVSGNTLDVETFTVYEATSGCTSRAEYRGRDQFVLESRGRATVSGSYTATQKLRGPPCPTGPTSWSNNYSNGIGSWRPN